MEYNLNQPEECINQTGEDITQRYLTDCQQDVAALVVEDRIVKEQQSQQLPRLSEALSPSEYGTTCSREEKTTTCESTDKKVYQFHIGTQPGSYSTKGLHFSTIKQNHSELVQDVKILINCLKVEHKFIEKPTFSNSSWGLETYTCLTLYDTEERVMGIAALIGLALRQDAIGIYAGHYPSHRVFTVKSKDPSLVKGQKALTLMNIIIKSHGKLCGQFDKTGKYLEFHDFENLTSATTIVNDLKNTIRRYYGTHEWFEITDGVSQSDLLEKENYEKAIEKAKFEGFMALINLTRSSDRLYNNKELN